MIIYNGENGLCVIIPAPGFTDSDGIKDVPTGTDYSLVNAIPENRFFRNAWVLIDGVVVEDLEKSKIIANEIRREKRSAEFAPFDIMATIPAQAESAEQNRELIREKYALIQAQIDGCTNVENLKSIVAAMD